MGLLIKFGIITSLIAAYVYSLDYGYGLARQQVEAIYFNGATHTPEIAEIEQRYRSVTR